MALSSDLISQLVKSTKPEKPKTKESTSYGTAVEYEGRTYVKLDGSELLTPVNTTSSVKDGDRVTVMIKNHSATVMGNMSDPSASTTVVKEQGSKISEFEIIVAHKITTEDLEAVNATIENLRANAARIDKLEAVSAEIDSLEARLAKVDHLTATDIEAINAQIEHLEATFGSFTDLSAEDLNAVYADIGQLKAYTADFTYVSAEVLEAIKATINDLSVKKLDAESAKITYANIDFANIGEAAIRKIFADTGLIKELIVGDTTISGELVGVTIKGDLIEGNTVKADKLVVKGSDGLYYKLNIEAGAVESAEVSKDDLQNGLHGTAIIAKTITAEKISVKDLVAFGATIGGFTIKDHSLYSGVKSSATNTTRGIYLGDDGQISFGDESNYLRYFLDTDGQYKLEISAQNIRLAASNKTIEEEIKDLRDDIENAALDGIVLGTQNLIRKSTDLMFESYFFNSCLLIVVYDNVDKLSLTSSDIFIRDDGEGTITLTTHPRITCSYDDEGTMSIVGREKE